MLDDLPGIHHFGESSHPDQALKHPAQTSVIMREGLITEHPPRDYPTQLP